MTAPAVISGSLVDAKNVHTHKSLRLIIDVPAEHAQKVFEAFGWPTMANPVSVAVARLTDSAAVAADRESAAPVNGPVSDRVPQEMPRLPGSPASERKPMSLASKVAMTCGSPTFQTWAMSKRSDEWMRAFHAVSSGSDGEMAWHNPDVKDAEIAAEFVRNACGVSSRSEIFPGSEAAAIWGEITAEYEMHQRGGRQ